MLGATVTEDMCLYNPSSPRYGSHLTELIRRAVSNRRVVAIEPTVYIQCNFAEIGGLLTREDVEYVRIRELFIDCNVPKEYATAFNSWLETTKHLKAITIIPQLTDKCATLKYILPGLISCTSLKQLTVNGRDVTMSDEWDMMNTTLLDIIRFSNVYHLHMMYWNFPKSDPSVQDVVNISKNNLRSFAISHSWIHSNHVVRGILEGANHLISVELTDLHLSRGNNDDYRNEKMFEDMVSPLVCSHTLQRFVSVHIRQEEYLYIHYPNVWLLLSLVKDMFERGVPLTTINIIGVDETQVEGTMKPAREYSSLLAKMLPLVRKTCDLERLGIEIYGDDECCVLTDKNEYKQLQAEIVINNDEVKVSQKRQNIQDELYVAKLSGGYIHDLLTSTMGSMHGKKRKLLRTDGCQMLISRKKSKTNE